MQLSPPNSTWQPSRPPPAERRPVRAELCELAAELTPDDAALARQRRLRAARFHRLAGDGARAVTLLERLLAETSPGLERSDVLFELAMSGARGTGSWLGTGAPLTIIEQLNQALTEADGDDARAVWILAQRAGINLWLADARSALVDAREALARAERVGDPVLLAMTIARTGLAESYAVEITPGLLERGVEIEDRHGLVLEYYESPRHEFSRLLVQLGELERPRDILEAMGEAAIARGDEGTRLMVTWRLGMLEWLAGRWSQALDHVTAARELVEQTQHPHGRSWVGRVKALVEADLGLVDQARASAQESLAYAQAAANEFFTITALGSLGRVELALGNHEAAGGYLSELPERLQVGGIDDPTIPLWADTIETLVALGEREQARVYLEQYEVNAQRLASPWAVAAAARCRGLFAAAEGDLAGAVAAAERALTGLAGLAYPFERGRALLVLGSVLRQAQHKERARATLEQALTIFEDLGARLWAAKPVANWRGSAAGVHRTCSSPKPNAKWPPWPARTLQQTDRRRLVHGRHHGRGPPVTRLPQARRAPCRARRPTHRTPRQRRQPGGHRHPNLGLSRFRSGAPEAQPRRHGPPRRALPPTLIGDRGGLSSWTRANTALGARDLGSTIVLANAACVGRFEARAGRRGRGQPQRRPALRPHRRRRHCHTNQGRTPMNITIHPRRAHPSTVGRPDRHHDRDSFGGCLGPHRRRHRPH